MNWYDTNPYGSNSSFMQSSRWDLHRLGRQQFTSNFARNGMSAMLFAATPGDAFRAVRGKTYEAGSKKHISNLRDLANRYPENPNIDSALKKAQGLAHQPKSLIKRATSGMLGGALNAGFAGLTFATTEGSLATKSKATISELVGMQGFNIGAAAGAAVGTAIMPVIGTAIGALAGGIGAQMGLSSAAQFVFNTTDRMVKTEQDRRNLNWVGNKSTFNSQGAYTMRQQSLQAMNRGLTTARTALGREAIMVHQ